MPNTIEAEAGKIVTVKRGSFKVHFKDDGRDYLGLWDDFRRGRLANLRTLKQAPKREVHVVEGPSDKLILKVDRQVPKLLETKLKQMLSGPMHSRIMHRVNRAVRRGCRVTPDIYLVAERLEKRICRETYIIQEFLPDPPLWQFTKETDLHGFQLLPEQEAELVKAMRTLHDYRLALTDINPHNILVSPEGYKIIDLSWGGSFRIGQALDVLRLRHKMNVHLPLRGIAERLAVGYLSLKYKIQDIWRSPERTRLRYRIEGLGEIAAKRKVAEEHDKNKP